jgi:hypothetical protein
MVIWSKPGETEQDSEIGETFLCVNDSKKYSVLACWEDGARTEWINLKSEEAEISTEFFTKSYDSDSNTVGVVFKHCGSEQPYIINLSPPLLLLSVNGTKEGQLILGVRDVLGNLLTLEGRSVSFSSSDPQIASVTEGGHVTAKAQGTVIIRVSVDGVPGINNTIVHVTLDDLPFSYITKSGQYVTFDIPRKVDSVDFEQMMDEYDVINATDGAYLLQKELTGIIPFKGEKQIFIGEPDEGKRDEPGELRICGLSGNPIRIGILVNNPQNNCLMEPQGNPHWGSVLWHEMGHNFTLGSVRFGQLYNSNNLYIEALASLAALYAEHRIINEPGSFGLKDKAVKSIGGESYGAFESLKKRFLGALEKYEKEQLDFSKMNPDVLCGILLRLADE